MNVHTPERGVDESMEQYKYRRKDSKLAYKQSQHIPVTNWPTNKVKLGKFASKLKRKRQ